jgi:hypothetical protein
MAMQIDTLNSRVKQMHFGQNRKTAMQILRT